MRPTPLSPYALQKLVGEQYCQMFTQLYGLETVTTRYFNVFGPRQQPGSPYSGVISLFIEALAEGRAPHDPRRRQADARLHLRRRRRRRACCARCEAPDVAGEVINVAGGGRISLLELRARRCRCILEADVEPTFGPTREGDVRDSQADIHKARQLLGFEPVRAVRRGAAPHGGEWARTAGA